MRKERIIVLAAASVFFLLIGCADKPPDGCRWEPVANEKVPDESPAITHGRVVDNNEKKADQQLVCAPPKPICRDSATHEEHPMQWCDENSATNAWLDARNEAREARAKADKARAAGDASEGALEADAVEAEAAEQKAKVERAKVMERAAQ
jgi:hypothetical protein